MSFLVTIRLLHPNQKERGFCCCTWKTIRICYAWFPTITMQTIADNGEVILNRYSASSIRQSTRQTFIHPYTLPIHTCYSSAHSKRKLGTVFITLSFHSGPNKPMYDNADIYDITILPRIILTLSAYLDMNINHFSTLWRYVSMCYVKSCKRLITVNEIPNIWSDGSNKCINNAITYSILLEALHLRVKPVPITRVSGLPGRTPLLVMTLSEPN